MQNQYGYFPDNPTESVDTAIAQRDALRTFARRVITICTEGDADGDFVLEMAVSEGLLRLVPDPIGGTCGGEPAMRYEPTECLGRTLSPNAGNNLCEPGTGERQVD